MEWNGMTNNIRSGVGNSDTGNEDGEIVVVPGAVRPEYKAGGEEDTAEPPETREAP